LVKLEGNVGSNGASLRFAEQAAMGAYRQELLDVPQQAGFPNAHAWPNKP